MSLLASSALVHAIGEDGRLNLPVVRSRQDNDNDNATLEVSFYRRKVNSIRRPLNLRVKVSDDWSSMDNRLQLMLRWQSHKPPDCWFVVSLSDNLQ